MRLIYLLLSGLLVASCHNKENKPEAAQEPPIQKDSVIETAYFPVTSYLRGQLLEVKQNGVTPVRVEGSDSSWVKVEAIEAEIKKFLRPEIDSSNMIPFFRETKYLDQTINAYCFSYEPKQTLPDSIPYRIWNVYVDPVKNNVIRVYIEIQKGEDRLQLHWESGKWCSIRTIHEPIEGESKEKSYVVFHWSYL